MRLYKLFDWGINHMFTTIKEFFIESTNQMQHYFIESKKEISKNNAFLMMCISAFGLPGVCILLLVTPMVISDWYITIGHWLFIPFFLCFGILGRYLYRNKTDSYPLVHLSVISFLMILMALVIYINTVPYPDSSATLVTAAMIVVPVLFIIPFYETIVMLFIVFLVFMLMNNLYISPEIIGDNIFNGIAGLMMGGMVSWIVTNLRAADNKDKREIVKQSGQDKLTGIQNKGEAEKNCFAYLESEDVDSCALIVIDIDNFKEINDTMGHYVGDQVLSLFGNTLKKIFRESDIFGRIGGDEFLVLMKNVSERQLVELKMEALSVTFHREVLEKLSADVTCSYGSVIKNHEYISYVPFFKMADKLLYRAKRNGKNQGEILTVEAFHKYIGQKEIMLVVEDEEINRELIKTIFSPEFEIIEAFNGAEAKEIIKKHHSIIRIMLLDIIMPQVDGFQVLNWMKDRNLSEHFPVIAISSDESMELKSLELGVADMITKPFIPEVMKKRVHNVLK